MQAIRPRYIVLLILAGILWACAGCQSAPAREPQAPPVAAVAGAILCEDPPLLDVATGLSSSQLEQVLYSAYLELLGQYQACRQVVVR